MNKVMARRAQKLAAKQQEAQGHPDSASTATPVVPGSAEGEDVSLAKEDDTQPTSMSPTNFVNKIDMDRLLDKG